MIADDRVTPILMDFGSAMKARVKIENRSQALLQQVNFPSRSEYRVLTHVVGHCRRAKYHGLPGTRTV